MTPDEAFNRFLENQAAHLPWEPSAEVLRPAFIAGWEARGSAETPSRANEPKRVDIVPVAHAIYTAYPRKIGKQAALKAIAKAAKQLAVGDPSGGNWEYLLKRTLLYADAVKRWPAADKRFIPHPATWYNRGSYDDDSREWQRGGAFSSQFTR
jgi:hypothetical protein